MTQFQQWVIMDSYKQFIGNTNPYLLDSEYQLYRFLKEAIHEDLK